MEMWDIYNKERKHTGIIRERGTSLSSDEFHLVVHICIFNSNNEMLIQHRQPFKSGWPNLWDISVGGSAIAGESSGEAAKRELHEEIGYDYDMTLERPYITVNFDQGFDDFYILEKDIDLKSLSLQYEEVKAVKWASEEEIIKLLDDEMFVPFYSSLIKVLFEMRASRGALKGV